MSNAQIKYFGTKRQRAALKNRRKRNASRPRHNVGRRRHNQTGIVSQAEHAAQRAIHSVEQAAEDAIGAVTRQVNRRRNVGEILTILPANPGRKRRSKVAAKARRRNRGRASNRTRNRRHNRTYNRRHNVVRHRRRNSPKVVVRYRNRRRHNAGRRRRNQGSFLAGDAGKVIGVLGGAAVTGIITGFLPASLTSGTMGYITTAVTAVVLGQLAGKMTHNRSLGTFITVGGLLIVGLQLVGQFFPSLQLPFTTTSGTSGLGLLTSSNFFVPQVNLPGSMASFVAPAAIPAPMAVPASTLRGLGQGASPLIGLRSARRTGRLR